MILALDIGNTHIYGGLFETGSLDALMHLRRSSNALMTSDEFGVFLRSVMREQGFDPRDVSGIVCCSVVPALNYSLRSACMRYFGIEPLNLGPGVKTGLKIRYKDPGAVGADRIANAAGALRRYPDTSLIIADFGTATTLDAVSSKREYLGGAIFPGLRTSAETLASRTAKLPTVELGMPLTAVGRTTEESINAGIYYAAVGAVKELTARFTAEQFRDEKPLVIATGGFSRMLESSGILDAVHPDLVLEGLLTVLEANA
jgi:type III pantothenate kinase